MGVILSQEVARIRTEHPDDEQAVFNGRVKGQLKVTRAFGAGFLKRVSTPKSSFWLPGPLTFPLSHSDRLTLTRKQPNMNEALLEMFRIKYVGVEPYVSWKPCMVHHRLTSGDRFLLLSSDGLYQYFSNEEVVAHVAWFMDNVPEGDPAQYLITELLFRAAKKNGENWSLPPCRDMQSYSSARGFDEQANHTGTSKQGIDDFCYISSMIFAN